MKNHEELSSEDHEGVRRHAARLLAEAAAVGRFPTPIEDLLTAAKVRLIEEKIDQGYAARLYRQAVERRTNFLRAIGKVLGLCHPDERLILIDESAHTSSKPFIKLHETAHVYMPHQRQVFAMMNPKTTKAAVLARAQTPLPSSSHAESIAAAYYPNLC